MEEDETINSVRSRSSTTIIPSSPVQITLTNSIQSTINLLTTPAITIATTFAGIASTALATTESTIHSDYVDNLIQSNPQNQSNDYDDSALLYDQSLATDRYASVAAVTQQLENFTNDVIDTITIKTTVNAFDGGDNFTNNATTGVDGMAVDENNYWALFALVLVIGTAAGNILVCLAIAWERRLQNVTNYFLMSLAITDLMVAILVMPLGILTLVKGEYIEYILNVFD